MSRPFSLPGGTVYVKEAEKWEYRIEVYKKPPSSDALNDIGKDGWELVTVVPGDKNLTFYFKRVG